MAFWKRRPTPMQLEQQIREKMVDDIVGDEAKVPEPFYYHEDHDEATKPPLRGFELLYKASSGHQVHGAQPYPKPTRIFTRGNLDEIPPLKHSVLDPDKDPVRLLVLSPHFGKTESPVQGTMIDASLTDDHYCYIAVRNTRGHPKHTTQMIINGQKKTISKNVEVFLRNIRTEKTCFLLYIREVCVNREDPKEVGTFLNALRERYIFDKSCCMLNMDDFMEEEVVVEASKLAPKQARTKNWADVTRNISSAPGSAEFPTHSPIRLGSLTTPKSPYSYLPLDIVAGEIRLLALLPAATKSEPLEANLAHEALYGPCAYACLSYTWGEQDKVCELILNGQTLRITRSLDAALRALRPSESYLVLWVDAICINQVDMREKSRQIPRMYSIYEAADGVIIWLGPSRDSSDQAMDLIDELWQDSSKVIDWGEDGSFTLRYTEENCRAFRALCALVQRPYFTRLWVVQEVAMASIPTIWCGSKRVGWDKFLAALQFLQVHIDDIAKEIERYPEIPAIERSAVRISIDRVHHLAYHRKMQSTNQRASLLYLALLTQWADSTDPRDKLYGIWDLAADARSLRIIPSYQKSPTDVYIEFVKGYIFSHKNLDILCATQACDCAGRHDGEPVPSWCPDWRHKLLMRSLVREMPPVLRHLNEELVDLDKPIYSAARKTQPAVGFAENDRVLICSAAYHDVVALTIDRDQGFSTGHLGIWRDVARKHTHRNGTKLPEAQIDEQYWSMILGETKGALCEVRGNAIRIDKFPAHRRQDFFETVEGMFQARKLAFTSRGYMALVPHQARPGMRISILLGCSVPMLLEECQGHFHIRGSCFVQGWMRGEILDAMGMSDNEIFEQATNEAPLEIR